MEITNTSHQSEKPINIDKVGIIIKFVKAWDWGKNYICGSIIGKNSRSKQVQEIYETIYYLGYLRIIIVHDFKFKEYDK